MLTPDDPSLLDFLNRLTAVLLACGEGSSFDTLYLLAAAYLTMAEQVRAHALFQPGGFPAERARQVEQLRGLADLIEADTPDLETERLQQEEDFEGMVRRIQQQMDDLRRELPPLDGSGKA